MNINTKKLVTIATGMALAASVALPAFAETENRPRMGMMNPPQVRMGERNESFVNKNGMNTIMGIVSAISGNSITLASHQRVSTSTSATTTYTVDASTAVIRKHNATTTISTIVVGDRLVVVGTVTGTTIKAKTVSDVLAPTPGERGRPGMMGSSTDSTNRFMGNGEPVVAGSVTAVSSSTITVTTATNIVYTVDITKAKILQGQKVATLADIIVGEKVIVQGTINGSSVAATTVIDQKNPGSVNGQENGERNGMDNGKKAGFFGRVGGFFKGLFGF